MGDRGERELGGTRVAEPEGDRGTTTEAHTDLDVDVDLVALERDPDDDITVVVEADPPSRRGRSRVIVALAGAGLAGLGLGAALLVDGEGSREVDTTAPGARPVASTPDRAERTVAPIATAKSSPEPTAPAPPVTEAPATEAPRSHEPVAPPVVAPNPTVAPVAVAVMEATLDPATASVAAGTEVVVTLRVRNAGGAAGAYTFDTDGCPPALVPNPELVCTMVVQILDVPAGGEATHTITVGTAGAAPGEHVVTIGDRELRVTIG